MCFLGHGGQRPQEMERAVFRKGWDCNPGEIAGRSMEQRRAKTTFWFGGTPAAETQRALEVTQGGLEVHPLGGCSSPGPLSGLSLKIACTRDWLGLWPRQPGGLVINVHQGWWPWYQHSDILGLLGCRPTAREAMRPMVALTSGPPQRGSRPPGVRARGSNEAWVSDNSQEGLD